MEIDFDGNLYGNRVPIFHTRLEAILFSNFDRFFIQPHTQRAENAHFSWDAVDPNDHADEARALIFCLTGFFRKFCFRRVNWARRAYAATYAKYASANASASAGTDAGTFA